MLHFGLTTLEEVEGVRRFGVHMLHDREDIQDVLLCEGGLVAAVKVILLNQDLGGEQKQKRSEHGGHLHGAEDEGSLNESYLDASFD